MWKKLYSAVEGLIKLAWRVSRHDDQIRELRQEVRELAGKVNLVVIELNRLSDRQDSDREYAQLWVENQLLKFERRLLPVSPEEGNPPKTED